MIDATPADRRALPRHLMLAGAIASIVLIAVILGWRAAWLPEPMMDVLSFVFSSFLLDGAVTAVKIAALAMIGGSVLGLMLALMRLSALAAFRDAAWLYIWFIRGTPVILQLVFLYDALPAIGIKLDSFTTAVVGFTLNEAAFCAEIRRASCRERV